MFNDLRPGGDTPPLAEAERSRPLEAASTAETSLVCPPTPEVRDETLLLVDISLFGEKRRTFRLRDFPPERLGSDSTALPGTDPEEMTPDRATPLGRARGGSRNAGDRCPRPSPYPGEDEGSVKLCRERPASTEEAG